MSYEKELAFYLRQRGMSEGEVAEALAEVRAYPAVDDAALVEEFGPPPDYAAKFPERGSVRTPGKTIMIVAVGLAAVYAIIRLIVFPFLDIDLLDGTGPIRLWPALAVLAAGLVIGFLVDRHRPVPDRR